MLEIDPCDEAAEHSFAFQTTPAVLASRTRRRFVNCSICQVDNSQYLFHRTGIRFVRCRGCGAVYVNPLEKAATNYFDMDRLEHLPGEETLLRDDFHRFMEELAFRYEAGEGRRPWRTLLLGKFMRSFASGTVPERVGLRVVEITDDLLQDLALRSETAALKAFLDEEPEVVVLHELLEACSDPGAVLGALISALPPSTWFVVTYTNVSSLPARLMRRHWSAFFSAKTTFLSTGHLGMLFARHGFVLSEQIPLPKRHTLTYIAQQLHPEGSLAATVLERSGLGRLATPVRVGNRVAIFRSEADLGSPPEKLSVVMPVYNEARYCAKVIEAVLAKDLSIDKELIIVESNSTDGTREVVRGFEGCDGVKVIYEEKPQGKGHAVRTGLRAVSGTVVIIQDADFEYDIDDYDALLEPILQHKTDFVLGSRTLGLDSWKVRQLGDDRLKGLLMNAAQVLFATTYNVLYQQRVTDVNTMYKVFRARCLDQFDLESDGFEFDMELACKLARSGYAPMEVPVNYVARSFAQGKKIRFFHDFFRSYSAFIKHRLEQSGRVGNR